MMRRSWPRARFDLVIWELESFSTRLSSEATWRLMAACWALKVAASADTTVILSWMDSSERLSTAVVFTMEVVRSLRSCLTWPKTAFLALPRSATVFSKRESARAACLGRASLRAAMSADIFSSASLRSSAIFWYWVPNFLSAEASDSWILVRRKDSTLAWRAASADLNFLTAAAARFSSAAILVRTPDTADLILALVAVATFLSSLAWAATSLLVLLIFFMAVVLRASWARASVATASLISRATDSA